MRITSWSVMVAWKSSIGLGSGEAGGLAAGGSMDGMGLGVVVGALSEAPMFVASTDLPVADQDCQVAARSRSPQWICILRAAQPEVMSRSSFRVTQAMDLTLGESFTVDGF